MFHILPDNLILQIFGNFSFVDVVRASECCRTFRRIAQDEILWRNLFHRKFGVSSTAKQPIGDRTWREAFIRLVDELPSVETESLTKHTDEVLHVSFSPDGQRFATTSKDGFIHVWNTTTYPIQSPEFSKNMISDYSWKFTCHSAFNESSTLLMVSGPITDPNTCWYDRSEEIAIFSAKDEFRILRRVKVKPFVIFGAWYSDKFFFSGNNSRLQDFASESVFWLEKVPQFPQEVESNDRSFRKQMLHFNNPQGGVIRQMLLADYIVDEPKSIVKQFTTVSRNMSQSNISTLQSPNIDSPESTSGVNRRRDLDADKLLIYTCGTNTASSYIIGFNRITSEQLKEAVNDLQKREDHVDGTSNFPGAPDRFNQRDHELNLKGSVLGMTLSPDHRFLYVNCRSWPEGYDIVDPLRNIAKEVDIHIIDLAAFRVVRLLKAVQKCRSSKDWFLLFLDASDLYFGSGAADGHGYIFDRHYVIPLIKLPHTDVVNCVAFNPVDPQMLVSVSDDLTIKIWRSKHQLRNLGLDFRCQNQGIPLYPN